MLRIGVLLPAIAAFLIISAIQSVAHPQTTTVPDYFFKLWQVQSNCIEQGADPASQSVPPAVQNPTCPRKSLRRSSLSTRPHNLVYFCNESTQENSCDRAKRL